MPRIIIALDQPIKDFDRMSAWERETVVNETIFSTFNMVMEKFEVVTLVSENSTCDTIVLDPDNPHIIARQR
jgi:hypothetical protein